MRYSRLFSMVRLKPGKYSSPRMSKFSRLGPSICRSCVTGTMASPSDETDNAWIGSVEALAAAARIVRLTCSHTATESSCAQPGSGLEKSYSSYANARRRPSCEKSPDLHPVVPTSMPSRLIVMSPSTFHQRCSDTGQVQGVAQQLYRASIDGVLRLDLAARLF